MPRPLARCGRPSGHRREHRDVSARPSSTRDGRCERTVPARPLAAGARRRLGSSSRDSTHSTSRPAARQWSDRSTRDGVVRDGDGLSGSVRPVRPWACACPGWYRWVRLGSWREGLSSIHRLACWWWWVRLFVGDWWLLHGGGCWGRVEVGVVGVGVVSELGWFAVRRPRWRSQPDEAGNARRALSVAVNSFAHGQLSARRKVARPERFMNVAAIAISRVRTVRVFIA